MNFVVPGAKYCPMHDLGAHSRQKKAVSMYRLAQYQARVEEMMNGEQSEVLGLRNEIGILRMKLEAILNDCRSPADLMIHSQKINMTVQLISKLVTDTKKLESALGHLLDRQTVMILCDRLVGVVAEHITDGDALEKIAAAMTKAVEASVMERVFSEGAE